ncbi:MAG: CatA-like O-acetyltransferase [Parabacteroides johnsonii]
MHISPTIGREDGTFGFGFFEYNTNINRFIQTATQEIERVKTGQDCHFPKTQTDRMSFTIGITLVRFSEMKHATSFKNGDSVPRISTGKLMQEGEKHLLPISICVHHGLMDGRDVADLIQKLSNSQTAS